jgi:predicted esterase
MDAPERVFRARILSSINLAGHESDREPLVQCQVDRADVLEPENNLPIPTHANGVKTGKRPLQRVHPQARQRHVAKASRGFCRSQSRGGRLQVMVVLIRTLIFGFLMSFTFLSSNFVGLLHAHITEGGLSPSPDLNVPPASQPTVRGRSAGEFVVCESNGTAGKHKYSIFVPADYHPKTKYPAIVFLHGMGEQADDGVKCRTVGLGPAIEKRKNDFPFIAIFPQDGGDWTTSDSEKIMLDAIADAKNRYSIDDDRIALTGMSTGGTGVWVLGARHPEIFSCLVPVAAQKDDDDVSRLAHFPIWAFANDQDPFVNPDDTRETITRLRAAGAHPKVTFFHSDNHDCWDAAYNDDELYTWMLAQHRS